MLVAAMFVIGLLVLGAVVVWAFRRMTIDEASTESRLRAPQSHALAYTVPVGQDPAVLVSALKRAGFTAIGEMQGGTERLLVDCPNPDDRAQVRDIIEHERHTHFENDGTEIYVGHVTFEDER
jgi:hypothetical protein